MSYQLNLRHIRYFLAVAEDLHFRKAAERLFISQPGLSRQIREMEAGLGVQLFDRNNRKVQLTKVGLFLQQDLVQHVKSIENSIHHARLLEEGLTGELKMGYVGSAMQKLIPQMLVSLREKSPKVLVNLKEMDNLSQVDDLLSFDLDIGFVRLERAPKGLKLYPVVSEPFCLVLPQSHHLDSQNFENIRQLEEEAFILFDSNYSPSYYEKVMQIFDDSGFTPHVTHNTIHAYSIYKLVENNFGVSIVPKSLQYDHLTGVKFIELDGIAQRTTLSAIWNIENNNPVIAEFLNLINERKSG